MFATTMKAKTPVPKDSAAWLDEIVLACLDAAESIPFMLAPSRAKAESDLFHLGPIVCLKFRGLKPTATNLKRATDAALASYVATSDLGDRRLDRPQVAFALCYVASHFGLDLIDEEAAAEILDSLSEHADTLIRRTHSGRSSKKQTSTPSRTPTAKA
jgi:hypothetical protein